MSHFYGVLHGQAGEATRCGSKDSGIHTVAASWRGAVSVQLGHDSETGEDWYAISLIPWYGRGEGRNLARGNFKPNG